MWEEEDVGGGQSQPAIRYKKREDELLFSHFHRLFLLDWDVGDGEA